MRGKAVCLIAVLILCMVLSGCKDYKDLDQLTIIAGIAIDESPEDPKAYVVTFEIVDTRYSSDQERRSTYRIETLGYTLNEAVNKLRTRMKDNLSFSHVELLVISWKIAAKRGLHDIIDPFLRDSEIRNNMMMLISRAETAKEIITPRDGSNSNTSFELSKALEKKNDHIYSPRLLELYEIYSTLVAETVDLVLPAIRYSENDENLLKLDGAAMFQGEYLVGFLEEPDLGNYMLASTPLTGGAYTLNLTENKFVSFSLRETRPRESFVYDGEKFTFSIYVEITVDAKDFSKNWQSLDGPIMQDIEAAASKDIAKNVSETLEYIVGAYGVDILGFSRLVYGKNPKLWDEVKKDWDELYREAEFDVEIKVYIENTGLIMNY